jgi:hypothetical protein
VNAERSRPNRNEIQNQPDVGGTERRIDAPAALPADQLGDLAALAASLPGVQLVDNGDGTNGYSVLGLGGDQNGSSLNGMNGMGMNNLPRDAGISTSLSTSPYDVSLGGFSGARMNVRTRPGTNFLNRGTSLLLEAPQMQWTDAAARALGQEYTNGSLSGNLSGPVVYDKAFYSASYQLGRRSNDLQSLVNTDPVGLRAAGVAADSVTRLLQLLQGSRVPYTVGGIPGSRLQDQGSVLAAFDVMPPSSTSGAAYNATLAGGWSRQNPVGALQTELPSHSGDRTSWNVAGQGRHSGYVHNFIFTETSLGLSGSRMQMSPYLQLPDGRVRVSSDFGDGTSSVQTLAFGGSQSLRSSSTSGSAGLQNQLSWFSLNNKHRLKLTSELRYDALTQEQEQNLLGSFVYNSLADLQANRPASYSRTLSPRERDVSQVVGGLSLGDSYRPSQRLQLQYGVRVDANRFLATPEYNPELERALGVRNDRAPNGVFVSPRVGFSWSYGQAAQVGAFAGAFRGPRAVVRGGVGLFQNTPQTQLLGAAVDATGLATGAQSLACVGPATPTPDWNAYMSNPLAVPGRCADGSTGSLFANTAPSVTLFAKNFAPQRRVSSNLQWSGAVLDNRLNATLEGTYALNLNQGSAVDLNFLPTRRFTLDDEGSRPVFVQPTSIVPATGSVASRDARVSPLFNRVNEQRSDMRSEARQLSLGISPTRFSSGLTWNASYVFSDVRERVRGFTSTAGNPLEAEWARGFTSRHQVTYSLGYNFFDWVTASWFGRVQSGAPFTPSVAGDVNGDGAFGNDRAFVFDPARTSDPALAQAMRSLLSSGSGAARECLAKQLGVVAGRNSCEGPWTSTASLSFRLNPLKFRIPQRALLTFQVNNPLGAADLVLHGEDNLRGWGQTAFPDQSLLYVRGFDAATRRYKYDVNPRFGATNPQFSTFRQPVTVNLMLRLDVGPTRERQMLTQSLDRGRRHTGQKLPEMLLKAMYGTGGIQNPMAQMLRQQDSLNLTAQQADSLASMNRRYTVKLDSIWSPVASYLAKLPDDYGHDDAYDRYRAARRASVDQLIKLAPTVKALLTPEQLRKLPPFLTAYLDTRYLASIRSGTAGNGGGGPMMMGMPAVIGAGGGGATRVEIR